MKQKIPQHIAFIMDGNRRWAKDRHLLTFAGHKAGYHNLERIVEHAKKLGIKYVTFWAFSTENWKRDKKEVSFLLDLLKTQLKGDMLKRMIDKGGRITILGDITPFSDEMKKGLKDVEERSKDNETIFVNIGLNYGGRAEILHAVNAIIKSTTEEVTEEIFSSFLYTKGQPDPDLIIRTGGDQRLSGYLPWQGVYSELYFTNTYWPDFDEKAFDKALDEYAARERRFGK